MDKRRNDKKADKAIQLYNSGKSISEISSILGGTRQSIHDLLKRRSEYNPRKKPSSEAQFFNKRKYTKRNNDYFLATTMPRTLMHRDVWEYYNGKIEKGFDIHHKDGNKANNKIENLELLSKEEHARRFSTGNNQYGKFGRKK